MSYKLVTLSTCDSITGYTKAQLGDNNNRAPACTNLDNIKPSHLNELWSGANTVVFSISVPFACLRPIVP